jgi:lambda repressor-like predicted transcriptional regulator
MTVDRADKARRLRLARGISGYVPTTLVARHVTALKAGGWTEPEIAAAAQVDRRTVRNIVTTAHPRVHRHTATVILALSPSNAPNRVPAVGAMRRIQALAVMGWPIAHIGTAAGMQGTQVNELMAGRRKRIPRQQAEAIDKVFRALWATPGPSRRTRTVAARNGWVPALAWDDIDNPEATPHGIAPEVAA